MATGKVRWVFVNFPLTSIHPNAAAAAEVGLCAAQQNAFWPVHDLLYRHQDVWAPLKEPGGLLRDPRRLGEAVEACAARLPAVAGHAGRRSKRMRRAPQRAGANSTPTFYIEGGLLVGAQPLPIFRQVLDSILKVKGPEKGLRRQRHRPDEAEIELAGRGHARQAVATR